MDEARAEVNGSSATTQTWYSRARSGNKPARTNEKLALVLPALHEAENLEPLVREIRSELDSALIDWELIVVDDLSRDGTEEIVSRLAREDPRVRLLVRRSERGLAGAILHGWRHSDAPIVGVMDADGQHPPEALPQLFAAIRSGCELAIASRYAKGGRGVWNPVRRAVSRAAVLAARPLRPACGHVGDPLSGCFMVRRGCIENVRLQTRGYKLLLEILVRARIGKIEEIPIAFARRRAGRSKANFRVAWDYLILLARLYRARFHNARRLEAVAGD